METKFKVGDKVKAFGLKGEIFEIEHCYAHPISVKFKITNDDDYIESFTYDGRLDTKHKEPVLTLIERPKTKKRVMMYPALMSSSCGGFYISVALFRNIEEAKTDFNNAVRLLTNLGVEVEVEE